MERNVLSQIGSRIAPALRDVRETEDAYWTPGVPKDPSPVRELTTDAHGHIRP